MSRIKILELIIIWIDFFKGIIDYNKRTKWISEYSPIIISPFIKNDNINRQSNLQTRAKH